MTGGRSRRFAEDGLQCLTQVSQPVGFAKQFEAAQIFCAQKILRIARSQQYPGLWIDLLGPSGDVISVEPAGHYEVTEQQIHFEPAFEELDRARPVRRFMDLESKRLKARYGQIPHAVIILDDEDGFTAPALWSGIRSRDFNIAR